MAAEVMTSDELASTPPEHRYYVCQGCKKTGTDSTLFKMVSTGLLGFVICLGCLGGDR